MRTQPYGVEKTLISNIDDLIINTILEIRQPIIVITHSETSKDLELCNLLDFLEEDSTFFDSLGTQVGGSRPLDPPNTNPPLAYIPSPQMNFNFGGDIEAN